MARKPADQSVNRDDIIRAAANVLQRHGYDATTMKDIAAAVNLTAASLYHHFENKDALLLAVLEAGLELAISRTETIAHSDLAEGEKLRQMICSHIVGLTQNTAVGAAMVFEIRSLMGMKPPANGSTQNQKSFEALVARRDSFFARRDEFEKQFGYVIRQGIEKGIFRSVDIGIFTKMMLGAHNWVGVWYKPNGRLNGTEIAEMMADSFLRALKP